MLYGAAVGEAHDGRHNHHLPNRSEAPHTDCRWSAGVCAPESPEVTRTKVGLLSAVITEKFTKYFG